MTIKTLETEYQAIIPLAARFADALNEQLSQLLENKRISLSFRIQQRVKTWASVAEKIKRLSLSLSTINDLNDLVGLRLVLPFIRDIDTVCQLISSNFKVVEQYDTQKRLREDQFGYASVHFIIQLPESWLIVPKLNCMRGLRAEVQVRTAGQHLWAVASHILQYKHEKAVPESIRRAIHRLSAVLETVDQGFEAVLKQKEAEEQTITEKSQEEVMKDPETIKAEALGRLIKALPEEDRRLVELYYFGGFVLSEAAALLGLNP